MSECKGCFDPTCGADDNEGKVKIKFRDVSEGLPESSRMCIVITVDSSELFCLARFNGFRWDVQPFKSAWYHTPPQGLVRKWAYIERDISPDELMEEMAKIVHRVRESESEEVKRKPCGHRADQFCGLDCYGVMPGFIREMVKDEIRNLLGSL